MPNTPYAAPLSQSGHSNHVAREAVLQTLRASEIRYRRLFETARDGILLLNVDTAQIEDVNPYLVEMLGYSHAEFLGKKLWEVGAFADIAQSKEMFQQLQESGYVRYDDLPLKTTAGQKVAVEFVSNSYECDGIKVIQCNIRNISDRKRAEAALFASEAKVRISHAALKSVSQGVIITGTDRLIVASNDAFATLTGYSAAEILGRNCNFLQGPLTEPSTTEAIRAALNTGIDFFGEILNYRKDGSTFWNELSISPVYDDQGYVTHFVGVQHDVNARKEAEALAASMNEQLRESQKMEAIGTLASGIAHDFNNVIATILGNVELAREDLPRVNTLAIESLAEIHKAATRARDLVQQILSFSRRQPTTRLPIALAPVVAETEHLLRSTLPGRVTLDVRCAEAVPEVHADPTQIQQVMINLATNAMQAMQGGPGLLTIRLGTVMLDAALARLHPALHSMHEKTPGLTVRLAVSDNGPGMDVATLARSFEPFFTTKPLGEGTGLGLSVVRSIVQGHEGAIVVESAPGKGTTFAVYLPVAPPQTSAALLPPIAPMVAAATESKSHAAGEDRQHLLYLDDEEALVFLVKRLMARRGFRVSGFTDQREALAALSAAPDSFDLLVTDYNMPGLSGLDVAREALKLRADLPVAIASGYIDETLRTEAVAAGAHELIFKASSVEALCDAFERAAAHSQKTRPAD